jgi:hypothetical protein
MDQAEFLQKVRGTVLLEDLEKFEDNCITLCMEIARGDWDIGLCAPQLKEKARSFFAEGAFSG